jgi:hypothetical protein
MNSSNKKLLEQPSQQLQMEQALIEPILKVPYLLALHKVPQAIPNKIVRVTTETKHKIH